MNHQPPQLGRALVKPIHEIEQGRSIRFVEVDCQVRQVGEGLETSFDDVGGGEGVFLVVEDVMRQFEGLEVGEEGVPVVVVVVGGTAAAVCSNSRDEFGGGHDGDRGRGDTLQELDGSPAISQLEGPQVFQLEGRRYSVQE